MGGGAADGHDARGVPPVRRYPDIHAQRLLVVFRWVVPLLCFFPNPAWLLLTVLQFLSYNVLIGYQTTGSWHFDPLLQWLTYGPFYLWLLWRALRTERSV